MTPDIPRNLPMQITIAYLRDSNDLSTLIKSNVC